MEKKSLTIKQQANRYGKIKWGCRIGEYLAAATPFVTIALVNADKYFVQYDGARMSVALFLGLGLMGFAIWGITEKKLENTYVSLMIKWAVVALIFSLLGELINDIVTIMWFALIGLGVAEGLEEGSRIASAKQQEKLNAIKKAQEQIDIDSAKEEKTVKVRIKKD